MICSSLIASQINKRNLAKIFILFLETDLQNGMWSWWIIVGIVLRSNSQNTSFFDNIKEFLGTTNVFLVKTDHIDISFVIFSDIEYVSVVEQIVELSTIDLVEGDVDL